MKLNVEQRRIIELEPNGNSLIKGVAGSGKTTVAIHRLSFLQEHYCPEEDETLNEVIDASNDLTLNEQPHVSVSIIGNVAAGIPTTVITEYDES